jgi:hypothetical protein
MFKWDTARLGGMLPPSRSSRGLYLMDFTAPSLTTEMGREFRFSKFAEFSLGSQDIASQLEYNRIYLSRLVQDRFRSSYR